MNRRELLGLSLAAVGGVFAPRFGRWHRAPLVVGSWPAFRSDPGLSTSTRGTSRWAALKSLAGGTCRRDARPTPGASCREPQGFALCCP